MGIILDNKISWNEHFDYVVKKTHNRMFCLRKLRSFHVSNQILQMFFSSVVGGVMLFGLTCWGGNVGKRDRGRLEKVIKKVGGVVGREGWG